MKRPREHVRKAFKRDKKGRLAVTRLLSWIRQLLELGLEPVVEILEELPNGDNELERLREAEIFWIASWKLMGADLTNMTDGGDGLSEPTAETLEKMSAAKRGPNHPNFGKKLSESTRRAISIANSKPRNKPQTPKQLLASSKPVICLDDGKTYPSIEAAARAYGLGVLAVGRVCRGVRKATRGGHRFAFARDLDL